MGLDDMKKDMQKELMQDIQEGKIWALRCVKTCISQDSSVYPFIFNIVRRITGVEKDRFFVEGCEAYFGAFDYYDGNILRSVTEIPMAVDPKDSIKIDEFEVLRSY